MTSWHFGVKVGGRVERTLGKEKRRSSSLGPGGGLSHRPSHRCWREGEPAPCLRRRWGRPSPEEQWLLAGAFSRCRTGGQRVSLNPLYVSAHRMLKAPP